MTEEEFKIGEKVEYTCKECDCCVDDGTIFDIVYCPGKPTEYIIQPENEIRYRSGIFKIRKNND